MPSLALSLLTYTFRIIARRSRAPLPEQLPGAQTFQVTSKDGVLIHGWHWKTQPDSKPATGTVFLLHGFTENCSRNQYQRLAQHLHTTHGLACVGFDLRMHGLSGHALPTFGTAESWDFRAVLDYADAQHWPKPYLAHGVSLGALTAQRTMVDDPRLSGAALIAPPGWPRDAIAKVGKFMVFQKSFSKWLGHINEAYGMEILEDGDRRNHPHTPAHRPRFLTVIGDRDMYGWEPALEVFEHWYPDHPGAINVRPAQSPDALKWFIKAEGQTHPGRFKGHLLQWEPLQALRDEWFTLMLKTPKSETSPKK